MLAESTTRWRMATSGVGSSRCSRRRNATCSSSARTTRMVSARAAAATEGTDRAPTRAEWRWKVIGAPHVHQRSAERRRQPPDSYYSSRSRKRDSLMESRSGPQQAASPLSSPRRICVSPSSHHVVATRERRSMSSIFKHEPMSPRKRRSMSSTPDFEPRPRIHRRSDHTGGCFGGGEEMPMRREMRRGGGLGAGKSVPMAFVMGNVATPHGGANSVKEEDVNADMNQLSSDTDASVLDDPIQTLLDHEDDNVDFASFDGKVKESFWNPLSVKNDNASAASASIFMLAPSQTSGNSSVSGHLILPKRSDSASFFISGAIHRQSKFHRPHEHHISFSPLHSSWSHLVHHGRRRLRRLRPRHTRLESHIGGRRRSRHHNAVEQHGFAPAHARQSLALAKSVAQRLLVAPGIARAAELLARVDF